MHILGNILLWLVEILLPIIGKKLTGKKRFGKQRKKRKAPSARRNKRNGAQ